MPKVSIVFTSYNHKDFLSKAVESLLAQSYYDFELIIIDDCSTDGSQEVLNSYNDSRIKLYLREKNFGGYVKSTNYGASLAKGEYIIFAQCDDFAESTQIEKLVSAMDSNNVGVVFSISNMIDAADYILGTDFEQRGTEFKEFCSNSRIIPNKRMMEFLFESCVIPNLSAALIRREIFEKVGRLSDKYVVLADWNLWLNLSKKCDFYFIAEPLNNFRQHDTTIRNSVKIKRQVYELFMMYRDFKKEISEVGINSLKFKMDIVNSFFWFYNHFENKNIFTFLSLLFLSLKCKLGISKYMLKKYLVK